MQTSSRKIIDCREFPSESKCTLTIAGTEAEVIKAATEHAISSHGHSAGPELVDGLRSSLRDEK
jgi:predicted small metal-binding protein